MNPKFFKLSEKVSRLRVEPKNCCLNCQHFCLLSYLDQQPADTFHSDNLIANNICYVDSSTKYITNNGTPLKNGFVDIFLVKGIIRVYLRIHRLMEFLYLWYILLSCVHGRPDSNTNKVI